MAIQRTVPSRAPAAPQRPAHAARPPRRGLWTLSCFFLFSLALIGGEVAARFEPDFALAFRGKVVEFLGRLPESLPPEVLLQWAGGAAVVLVLLLIWQAGRSRRPLFYPLALVLLIGSAAAGLWRGGRDLALESSADRVPKLESDLGALQKKLDVATGSLQKSDLALKEREELLTKLRAELEALKVSSRNRSRPSPTISGRAALRAARRRFARP